MNPKSSKVEAKYRQSISSSTPVRDYALQHTFSLFNIQYIVNEKQSSDTDYAM